MKSIKFKPIILSLIILLVGIVLGFLALCAVHLLPVERMHKNVLYSKDVINSYAEVISGYPSTTLDNYTDSIMLNEAICPNDAPLIERAIYNYQVCYFKNYTQQDNLLKYLEGEEGYGYMGYTHYWGGYLVPLKLLLLFFDYADIIAITTIMHGLMIVGIIVGLVKRKREDIVLPFVIAVMSIMPMAISRCMQYYDVFFITLLGALAIVWRDKRIKNERMYLVFLLLGMATSYFDFLTYPFVSLGIPLVFFLVLMDESKILKKIIYMTLCSAAWCFGYLGMWAGKWILSSVLLPEAESMEWALKSIAYRGSNKATGGVVTVWDVLLKNLFVYLKWPIIILFVVVGVYLLYNIFKAKGFSWKQIRNNSCYLFVCLYPIAWFFISKNHSFEHAFMTYRELVITVFSGFCMLVEMSNSAKD